LADNIFDDECRRIILKIIEQAIRDYISLENATAPIEKYYYQTARDFLFDDEYAIDYGGEDKTIHDLLDIVGLDIDWIRYRANRAKKKRELTISLLED